MQPFEWTRTVDHTVEMFEVPAFGLVVVDLLMMRQSKLDVANAAGWERLIDLFE